MADNEEMESQGQGKGTWSMEMLRANLRTDPSATQELIHHEEELARQQVAKDKVLLQQMAKQLARRSFPMLHMSPQEALNEFLKEMFRNGPDFASHIYAQMMERLKKKPGKDDNRVHRMYDFYDTLEISTGTIPDPLDIIKADNVWDNADVVTSLVLLLIATKETVVDYANWVKDARPRGLPTLQYIADLESGKLWDMYEAAKKSANAKLSSCTAIGVCMIDMAYERLKAVGKEEPYTSFNHSFVIFISPDGVTVYQGWRVNRSEGYLCHDDCEDKECCHSVTLHKWIESGTGVLNWEDADDLVKSVERLARRKTKLEGTKMKQMTRYFERCFKVDLMYVCREDGKHKPLINELDVKLRLHVTHKVDTADLAKYKWA